MTTEVHDRIWTVPNIISMTRLLMVPVFAVLIIQHHDVAAVIVLAVSGITDWLDGVIARKFNQTSKLGEFLDPAADRLFIIVTLVGLLWREIIPLWFVALLLLRELTMALVLLRLRKFGKRTLPVHFVGKAGTFALLYALPLLLLSTVSGAIGDVAYVAGWAFAGWGVLLYWWAASVYISQYRQTAAKYAVLASST